MFYLESLSSGEVSYRLSFQAGRTIDKNVGDRKQYSLFQIIGPGNKLRFSDVETYDRQMVEIYCKFDYYI
jgi:hypothetical protein